MKKNLVVLCILDGFGYRENEKYNAILQADTPTLDMLKETYPTTLLQASGEAVGLPAGQMGNSEVGHTVLGLGRVIMQDLPKISQAVDNGLLNASRGLQQVVDTLRKTGGACHLWGLLSDGGIHSHIKHLCGLIDVFVKNNIQVIIHACLDGRDTPPQSAISYVDTIESQFSAYMGNLVEWGTIGGRYFAMDRDKRWERIAKAYEPMIQPKHFENDIRAYINKSYQDGVFDEFILPTALEGYHGIKDGDAFIAFNYRTDRARQMMSVLVGNQSNFMENQPTLPKFSVVATMTEYDEELAGKVIVLFPREIISQTLGEVLSAAGLKQLRAAETEKYPHVTFFFNGGAEQELPLEERIMIASPKVATYDLQPEMSAGELTEAVLNKLRNDDIDVCIINFANGDMVGHTGNMEAAKQAVECVDKCVKDIFELVQSRGGHLLVTADHGNAEIMFDEENQQPHTAHTTNKVLFILASEEYKNVKLSEGQGLKDVAPTILSILSIEKPEKMTGNSLIQEID